MKILRYLSCIVFIFTLYGNTAWGNMASPRITKNNLSSVVFSDSLKILRERIVLTSSKTSNQLNYSVFYTVETESEEINIPLLFFARKYASGFIVTIDNVKIPVSVFPHQDTIGYSLLDLEFRGVAEQLKHGEYVNLDYDNLFSNYPYQAEELKYFKANLKKGIHEIHIAYEAAAYKLPGEWVYNRAFIYSLHPARYWKSFGGLEIELHSKGLSTNFETNLNAPISISSDGIYRWKFDQFPADFIEVTWDADISLLAKIMIFISPQGLALLFFILLVWLNYKSLLRYRSRNMSVRLSIPVVLGSILIPFVTFLFWMLSFEIIDFCIGPDAVGIHGYTFLVFVLYPFVIPIYFFIFNFLDKRIQKRMFALQKPA